MTEQSETTEVTAVEAAAKAEKKSYIRTLASGDERLQFLALSGKTGWSFYILHQRVGADKKVKNLSRGGAAKYPDLATASAAVDAGIVTALADGWAAPAKVGGGGGVVKSKPDAFSLNALPKPGAVVVSVVNVPNETSAATPTAEVPAAPVPATGKKSKK